MSIPMRFKGATNEPDLAKSLRDALAPGQQRAADALERIDVSMVRSSGDAQDIVRQLNEIAAELRRPRSFTVKVARDNNARITEMTIDENMIG